MTPKGFEHDEEEDDEASFADLVSLSTAPPPPNDVHNASTTVAELPVSVLALLKEPAFSNERLDEPEVEVEVVEMVDLTLGSDEPATMQLETVMIEAGILTPLPPSSSSFRAEGPRTIELRLSTLPPGARPISGVESEIARVPRGWMIAGTLVASVMAASVAFVLLWSLVSLL